MATRCYACKRSLTNPESVALGIGPVCRARRKREIEAQERLDREASRCHHGYNCEDPHHVLTLLGRLEGQLEVWPGWLRAEGIDPGETGVDQDINSDINKLMCQIVKGLGLRRQPVEVPQVVVPGMEPSMDEMLQVTGHYMHPANEISPGQYRIPSDIQNQYRRTILRERRVCPHGLDCTDPGKAVGAIYSILSILRNDLEPLFRDTSYGGLVGASDAAYVACMNMLEVLGLEDEASYIRYQDLPKLRKAAQKNARRWEQRKARKRGAA
ncbi:MAG: DUF6011 domain-containing protein [Bacillota bacterium]